MRNFSVVFVFITFLFFSGNDLKAQKIITDSLSFNTELIFRNISEQLLATPSKTQQKKSENLLEKFKNVWYGGTFNEKEQTRIKSLTDTLTAKKISPHPYLFQYINTLNYFAEEGFSPENLENWHKFAMELLLTQKPKDFLNLLKFTDYFLKSGRLSKIGSSYIWYGRGGKYRFIYDNDFKIRFEQSNLACLSKKDSSVIRETTGVFNYASKQWQGKSGKLYWERFGKETGKKIYAEFDDYKLDLTKNYFTIDSARLVYKKFFDHPQLGVLKDRVMSSPPRDGMMYPAFSIYEKGFELNKIYPDFNLKCNLAMEGQRLYASGYGETKPNASIKSNDTVYAKLNSEKFYLYEDRIESPHTEFIFYFHQDSIYHPDLRFRYLSNENAVILYSTMLKTDDVIPFTDSYHKMDLYVPVFYWDVKKDTVYLQKFKQLRKDYTALFESIDFYSPKEYYSLQVMDQRNPLYMIQDFIKKYEVYDDIIEVSSLAEFLRKPEEQIVALLIDLASKGFVIYDPGKRQAKVKPKLYHYLKAKKGLADYDAIHLVSKVSHGANAIIDLKTLDLKIYGIPEVTLSDSQAVYLYPASHSIAVKKNRDFSFEGLIQVGLLDFYVKNSLFVYDSFMLRLNYIDSMAFYTVEKDTMKADKYDLKRVNNVITQMIGSLYIDEPGNKSGVFKFPQYPIFANKDNGYVYFNKKEIQDSLLAPDKVYYRVEPFVFDSVSQFLTNGLAFKGALVTDSIFPEIDEPLTIMPDNSLGFVHHTPDTGYAVYGGKGRFYNEITLDNRGLQGNGRVDFLNATFNSPDLHFYPDSVDGTAYDFVVNGTRGGYDFPLVQGDSLKLSWITRDTNALAMSVLDSLKPVKMFDNALLNGTLVMTENKMTGYGIFKFDKADIASQNMAFTASTVAADSADFILYDDQHKNEIFVSKGYFVDIDFDLKKGAFKNLNRSGGTSFVEFPYNQYASTLSELTWLMDERKVILETPDSLSVSADTLTGGFVKERGNGEFIALNPEMDSLRFFAQKGEYNYNDYTIVAEGVKYILTGDAGVFPRNGMVKIKEDGRMDTLYQAVILTDTTDRYHKIYDAEVHILSKNNFTATGYVNYYDRNKLPQQIYLSDIATKQWGKTIGYGKIEAGDYFFLSPEYFFKGEVELISTEKYLKFKGGFRLNEDCVGNEDNWVAFERFIDPNHVRFEINENTKTADSSEARFGLAFSYRKNKFYPLLLQPKESVADNICLDAYGDLDFDTVQKAFRVGTIQRLQGNFDAKGSFVKLDNKHCVMEGDGMLNLRTKFYRIKFSAAGLFRHLLIPDSTYFRTSIVLDFHFDEELLKMMTDSLRLAQGKIVEVEKSPLRIAMREQLDKETINRLMVELSLYGQFKNVPEALKGTIIFSDVKLRWDPYSKSYISEGPIGVGFINGMAVNKYMDGLMQIQMGRSGSHIHFYLHPGGKSWYFFTYSNGIMQSISSDMNYNVALSEIKEDKRVLHPKDEDNYYEYVISTRRKKVDFLRRIDRINKMR